MSIQDIRQALADIPGAEALTMRYEDGGRVEVFLLGDKEIRVEAGRMDAVMAIRAALRETP